MDTQFLYFAFDWLHAHPERGMEEFETSAYLAEKLEEMGYAVTRNVGGTTGIIGILDSHKPGKTLVLRADMDALPYTIDGKLEYRHSCGHDSHSAMVLSTAKELMERGIPAGKLMILFQPAEELLNGALSIIESGLLDDADEILGIHIRPKEELSFGQVVFGLRHGASFQAGYTVKGVTAHGARPQQGINAIECAISILEAINVIRIDPRIPHSVKVTQFNGGGKVKNIIPDFAEVALDIRCQTNEGYNLIADKIDRIAHSVADAYGAAVTVDRGLGVPAAEYDDEMLEDLLSLGREMLGDKAIPSFFTPGGEDFHYFTQRLPHCKAAYLGLGAEAYPGLHNKDMTFIREAMEIGVNVLTESVIRRLGK